MTHFSTTWPRLPAAFAVLYLSFVPAVGRAALGVRPDCRPDLVPAADVTLPRELKVNQGVIDYAMGEPKAAKLVRALSNIFTELPPERMALLGNILRAPPSPSLAAMIPYQLNPFFNEHPHLVDQSVRDNYALLLREFLNSPLSPYDLGLLAVLTKGQRRVVMRHVSVQDNMHLARLHAIVGHPDYNEVVVALLKDPNVRAIMRQDFITKFGRTEADAELVAVSFMDRCLANARRGQADLLDLQAIYQIFQLLQLRVVQYAEDEGTVEYAFDGLTLLRDGYLTLMRRFLDTHRLHFSATRLIELLDYVYFATPLPIKADDIYENVVRIAKPLLNPVKVGAAHALAARALDKALARVAPSGRHVLKEIDLYPPRTVGKKVRSDAPVTPAAPTPAPIDRIPPERALAPYTSFGTEPPAEELKTDREYEFAFQRDVIKTRQRVRIGPEALTFFNSHPLRHQKALLNALYMGWSDDGSGLKEVWGGPRGLRCYRLKARGSFRGLLILKDKTWQLIKIVNKDDFDRSLSHLEPP